MDEKIIKSDDEENSDSNILTLSNNIDSDEKLKSEKVVRNH